MLSIPEQTWRRRHLERDDWARKYWDSIDAPHRAVLMNTLRLLGPVDTVLEVGCNAGPNLRLIHKMWPDAQLFGCDVNDEAISFAQRSIFDEGWALKAHLWTAPIQRVLNNWHFNPVDIVLSCYVLTYLEPPVAQRCVSDLARIGRCLVLAEPLLSHPVAEEWVPEIREFRHPYERWLEDEGMEVFVDPVVPPADGLNGIVVGTWGRGK